MDLASPLHSLIPSLDSAVLEVLAGTESALGPTQIARLAARGTRTGHLRVLERLATHGLVTAEPTNKGHVYRLNRDHVLVPALLLALGARREVLDRLTSATAELTPTPRHVSVFGSFARRGGTESSDIDMLIVTEEAVDESEAWHEQLRVLEDHTLSWTGNRLETLLFSMDHLAQVVAAGEPLVDALREEALTLHGPKFTELLKRAVPAGARR